MRKLRILFSTEWSKLNTGYACIADNLLRQFYATGKYEIAEHARYCKENEPSHIELLKSTPWKVYGNLPLNDQEDAIYKSHPSNEFGKWKHDQICLDFQPDVVVAWDDFWMSNHLDQSPLRRFYKIVLMPTVDSRHQNLEWIDFYQRLDHILAYTKFGYDVLLSEGGGLIPLRGVATPAVDVDTYKFVGNRNQHKLNFGLPGDSLIIGMVARNQRRKLYPDFAEAFVEFLERLNLKGTQNTYLYWHTSYPDVGWDLPKYIKNNGLSHKIIMTYHCINKQCNHWFPSFYQDAATACPKCGQKSATLSNSQYGIDKQSLACVYNFMDLYVQFVSNEGLGIPMLEAASCGVPITGTYYSGTQDLIDNLQGHPIAPRTMFVEAETSRELSLPSIRELVDYIEYFSKLPASVRAKLGFTTGELTRQFYGGWSGVAGTWMNVFDSIQIPEGNPWTAQPDFVPTAGIPVYGPDKMSDEQFVSFALADVLHRQDWVNSFVGLKLLRDLSWGRTVTNNLGFFVGEMSQLGAKPMYDQFDRTKLMQSIIDMRNYYNQVEQLRMQKIQEGSIK